MTAQSPARDARADAPIIGETLTTSASALVGIVREVVAHETTPNLYRVRITVDAETPDAFDKWTMVRVTP